MNFKKNAIILVATLTLALRSWSESPDLKIGQDHFKSGKYAEAAAAFKKVYDQAASQPCSKAHVEALVWSMNTYLKLHRRDYFRPYWNIAKACETSPTLEEKGGYFLYNFAELKVEFTASSTTQLNSSQGRRTQTVQEFIDKSMKGVVSLLSADMTLMAQANAEMLKSATPEVKKFWEDAKVRREHDRQEAQKEFALDHKLNLDFSLKQASHLQKIKPGATLNDIRTLLGREDFGLPKSGIYVFLLYTGSELVLTASGWVEPMLTVVATIGPGNRLVEIKSGGLIEAYSFRF